jgi:putative ABC transport system substrate-binding protein
MRPLAPPCSRRRFLRGSLALAGLGLLLTGLMLLLGCGSLPPLAQQPPRVPTVGYLCEACAASDHQPLPGTMDAAWYSELRDLGYVVGESIVIEIRSADGSVDRLPGLAAELVALPVDVLVTAAASPAARAAKEATSTIPIVFISVGDPVGIGLVDSLARPGGNVTGLSSAATALVAKRLELLKEIVPGARRVDAVLNFTNPVAALELAEMETAARALGLIVSAHDVRDLAALDNAFATIASQPPDALLISQDTFFTVNRQQIVQRVSASRLPSMYGAREFAVDGGLIAYGVNRPDLSRRAAVYVDKILKGARPADLPVERPTRFDLFVNLETARALGLTLPQSILLQATEIIQ